MSRNLMTSPLNEVPVVASIIVVRDFRPVCLARGIAWEKTNEGWEFTSLDALGFRSWECNGIDQALYWLERA